MKNVTVDMAPIRTHIETEKAYGETATTLTAPAKCAEAATAHTEHTTTHIENVTSHIAPAHHEWRLQYPT